MTAVLAAEWRKLSSIRSTYYLLGVAATTVLLGALFAWYAAGFWDAATAERQAGFRAAAPEQGFLPFVQLSLAVLGVLAITAEYATGTIRLTLAAVPRRWPVFAAKAGVVGVVALLAGQAIGFATFGLGRLIAGDRPMGFNESATADEVPRLLASGLMVAVVALVGLGLGAVLRSTAGAIVAVVVLLFVLPGVANFLPPGWGERIDAVLLQNLAGQLAGSAAGAVLSPLAALSVLVAYVVGPLGTAIMLVARRDA
jgi:ABC-2 type transport system permease protein